MQSIDEQCNDMQGGGVQRMAVFPLGELGRDRVDVQCIDQRSSRKGQRKTWP
jgi:hypothetical protein